MTTTNLSTIGGLTLELSTFLLYNYILVTPTNLLLKNIHSENTDFLKAPKQLVYMRKTSLGLLRPRSQSVKISDIRIIFSGNTRTLKTSETVEKKYLNSFRNVILSWSTKIIFSTYFLTKNVKFINLHRLFITTKMEQIDVNLRRTTNVLSVFL